MFNKEELLNIGSTIKKRRKKGGLSQKDIAHYLGLHIQTISRLERGNTLPAINTFKAICDFLHLDIVLVEKD